jgi:hypothetical protein
MNPKEKKKSIIELDLMASQTSPMLTSETQKCKSKENSINVTHIHTLYLPTLLTYRLEF